MCNIPFYPVPIRTIYQNGEWMRVHPNGCIEREGFCSVKPSTNWRIVGASIYPQNGRGNGEFVALAELLKTPGTFPWKWKNGKQRMHIRDFDHGSIREWGNPSHLMY